MIERFGNDETGELIVWCEDVGEPHVVLQVFDPAAGKYKVFSFPPDQWARHVPALMWPLSVDNEGGPAVPWALAHLLSCSKEGFPADARARVKEELGRRVVEVVAALAGVQARSRKAYEALTALVQSYEAGGLTDEGMLAQLAFNLRGIGET